MAIHEYSNKSIIVVACGLIMFGLMTTGSVQALTLDNPSYVLDPINITAYLNSDGTTSISLRARVINIGSEPISSIDIRIDSLDITLVKSTINGQTMDSSLSVMDKHTMITIYNQKELAVNDSVWISAELVSNDLQFSFENIVDIDYQSASLVFYMKPHTFISNFTFTAILPSHAILMQESVIPLFPRSNNNFTDGTNMGFSWFVQELYPGQERVFIVRYQMFIPEQATVQSDILTSSFFMMIGAIIGIAIAMSGPRVLSKIRQQGSMNYVGLTTEEGAILRVIEQHDGKFTQKELYRQLNISESKLSLILSGLEEREIIKRVRKGRQNTIYVVK